MNADGSRQKASQKRAKRKPKKGKKTPLKSKARRTEFINEPATLDLSFPPLERLRGFLYRYESSAKNNAIGLVALLMGLGVLTWSGKYLGPLFVACSVTFVCVAFLWAWQERAALGKARYKNGPEQRRLRMAEEERIEKKRLAIERQREKHEAYMQRLHQREAERAAALEAKAQKALSTPRPQKDALSAPSGQPFVVSSFED